MRGRASGKDVPFRPLDALFEPTTPEKSDLPTVDTLPLDDLYPFGSHAADGCQPISHPFHAYTPEKLRELADSIREHGVLMPLLVRPLPHSQTEVPGDAPSPPSTPQGLLGYEIISGHNRAAAARLAGLDRVPVTVRELDDDTATILMVDSNLRQREKLLPSEKAWAYRLKLEAIKHQGRRTSSQVETKFRRSDDLLASESPDSRASIQRYIRLTELLPPLLSLVDAGRLAMGPAVELSYLAKENQLALLAILEREELSPSLVQAQNLHKLSSLGKLDASAVEAILLSEPVIRKKVTLKVERIAPYFPRGTNPEEMEAVILKLLASWQHNREQNRQELRQR